jgi:hypothetical protein
MDRRDVEQTEVATTDSVRPTDRGLLGGRRANVVERTPYPALADERDSVTRIVEQKETRNPKDLVVPVPEMPNGDLGIGILVLRCRYEQRQTVGERQCEPEAAARLEPQFLLFLEDP